MIPAAAQLQEIMLAPLRKEDRAHFTEMPAGDREGSAAGRAIQIVEPQSGRCLPEGA